MMWKEFEELAGYEVSFKDYTEVIEPMYMALPNVTKQEFVKMIDKKRFALKTKRQIVGEMKKLAKEIAEVVEHTGAYQMKDELRKLAADYTERFYGNRECFYFNTEYTIPELQRGCTYMTELVVYGSRSYNEIERIRLVA